MKPNIFGKKVMLIAFCAAVASTFFLTSAMAGHTFWHRTKTTELIDTTPLKAASNEFRSITEAQAKEFQAKTSEASGEKRNLHKFHQVDTTRIVYLRTMPDKGYQTEEQYLKSKKTERGSGDPTKGLNLHSSAKSELTRPK